MEEKTDPDKTREESEDEIEVVEDRDEAETEDEMVADPEEKIAELEAKLAEEHERLLRTAAELDNFRKRARRDVQDAAARGKSEVLLALLPALDSLDLALKSTTEDATAASVLEGVQMVRKQFLGSMAPLGLQPIDSGGQQFDPNFHEAVAQTPSPDHEAGEVIEEMRKGYMLGERLLRASMVVVSAGKPEPPKEEETDRAKPEDEAPAEGDPGDGGEEPDGDASADREESGGE